MTNITYFYNIIRDDESASSSCGDQSFNSLEAEVEESASLYSVIAKACLACARSSIELEYNHSASVLAEGTVQECKPLLIIPSYTRAEDFNHPNRKMPSLCLPTPKHSNLRSFNFRELKSATRNFRPSAALEGSFGSVFKGWIDEHTLKATKLGTGMAIAVKVLSQHRLDDHTRWLAEVQYLGQLCHPNLVKSLGYCTEDYLQLLVYEFMPGGSLENHLFRRGLSRSLAVKVALGAAKGLAFLHSAKVIYQCFRTSNILLDEDYNAKLSIFRLAMAYDRPNGDGNHVSPRIVEGCVYVAPEYHSTGHLTAKSDVYSFGVVLLELFSGRRAISEECNLVERARSCQEQNDDISFLLDGYGHQFDKRSSQKLGNLALRCLAIDAKFRPNMDEVVRILQQLQIDCSCTKLVLEA